MEGQSRIQDVAVSPHRSEQNDDSGMVDDRTVSH